MTCWRLARSLLRDSRDTHSLRLQYEAQRNTVSLPSPHGLMIYLPRHDRGIAVRPILAEPTARMDLAERDLRAHDCQ